MRTRLKHPGAVGRTWDQSENGANVDAVQHEASVASAFPVHLQGRERTAVLRACRECGAFALRIESSLDDRADANDPRGRLSDGGRMDLREFNETN